MENNLQNLLDKIKKSKYATDAGNRVHAALRHVVVDASGTHGDDELARQISARDELCPFFVPAAQTEVPVAGYVNGHFISRRIDRMIVNHAGHTVRIMDYKTDVNRDAMFDAYVAQIREYIALVRDIYPGYTVTGYILWTHDFSLQQI